MAEERMSFQAEVSRLLDIVVHSLYSEKEIFLRELISNASDACDKLRYEAITRPDLTNDAEDFRISIDIDKTARTVTVTDNGIGMSRDELIANLGTIAKSGTAAFIEQLGKDPKAGVSLIGKFGVGFYSAFMVAETVEVVTRKAGTDEGWEWWSDGKGEFAIEEAPNAKRGTQIILYLKQDEDEFLESDRLRFIISRYSDHIAIPIHLDGDDAPVNRASALWMRPKNEITPDQYKEFYHHVAHGFDDPAHTVHWRAEGKIEYSALLFVPSMKPLDLFDPKRQHSVKLFVKRVFITDHAEGLLPPWLRFVRGVIDSEDLPLNVSREMLQNNPILAKIRQGVTRKILGELQKFAEEHPAEFAKFWNNFGAVLKEGLYEDQEFREDLLKLLRCHSTHNAGLVSLDAYVGRMKEGQDFIYYMNGDKADAMLKSPHLEGFRAREVEVLLFTDQVDDFWPSVVGAYQGKMLKSVTRASGDLGKIKSEKKVEDKPKAPEGDLTNLIARMKITLGDAVKDVRTGDHLTDSAVCLVADEGDLDIHLERFLKQHKQTTHASKRILEINPSHKLIVSLAECAGDNSEQLDQTIQLLFDQATLAQGEIPHDLPEFQARLTAALERSLKPA